MAPAKVRGAKPRLRPSQPGRPATGGDCSYFCAARTLATSVACLGLALISAHATLTLPESATETWHAQWPARELSSGFASVTLTAAGSAAPRWMWQSRAQADTTLGGRAGRLTTDNYRADGLELRRETWEQSDRQAIAIRYHLTNRSDHALPLDRIVPLLCPGPDALQLGGAPAGEWEMFAHGREKNHVPATLRLGTFDQDYAYGAQNAPKAGQPLGADGKPCAVHSDPVCLLRRAGDDGTLLLIGFLAQKDHLTDIVVETDAARRTLARVQATCLFDGALLPPDRTRTTNWLLLLPGDDPNVLLRDFADRVAEYHHVPKPAGPPPVVFCSWQYWGPEMTEEILERNLAALDAGKFPCDVVQLDDGWQQLPEKYGDWFANDRRWPHGLARAAERIARTGRRTGLWLAPYLASSDTKLVAEHPEWLLRDREGKPLVFRAMPGYRFVTYCLDPTAPGLTAWLAETFTRLRRDGVSYFKLDFMRSAFVFENARFHDPTVTRLEAYERGLAAIRQAVGPDAFINVCGGHFGASLGLADSQRSGGDTDSVWNHRTPFLVRQNLYRTWMSRLWFIDPDGVGLRRQPQPAPGLGKLSLGRLTDTEAMTFLLGQYLGGGKVLFSDPMDTLDRDRLALYRHIIPTVNSPARPLDFFGSGIPSQLLTEVRPACAGLPPWRTVAVVNWTGTPAHPVIMLDAKVTGPRPAAGYLAWEFMQQQDLGLHAPGDRIALGEIAPHASRLVKLVPWDGATPALAGTDLHFSGGGMEIAEWRPDGGRVRGRLQTGWRHPVRITAAFPDHSPAGYRLVTVEVPAGTEEFEIRANRQP